MTHALVRSPILVSACATTHLLQSPVSRLTCLLSPADKLAEQLNEDDEDEDDEEEVLDLTLGDDGEPSDRHPHLP